MPTRSQGPIEQIHPLQMTGAYLLPHRLEFRYQLDAQDPEATGQITAARLISPGGEIGLSCAAPGVLHSPIPATAGRYHLQIEAVAERNPDAPPLPWQIPVLLSPEALADWLAAEPLEALAPLGNGVHLRASRVLRRDPLVLLFWDTWVEGSDECWIGELQGQLRIGNQWVNGCSVPYAASERPHRVRPAAPGVPGSTLAVKAQVAAYWHRSVDGPLRWRIQHCQLRAPGAWRLALTLPAERPAALAPTREFLAGAKAVRLEELWLGHAQTLLLFGGIGADLDRIRGVRLVDADGKEYAPTASQASHDRSEIHFEPLPAGVTQILVSGEGPRKEAHCQVDLPLEAGAIGEPVDRSPSTPGEWSFGGTMIATCTSVTPEAPQPPTMPEPADNQVEPETAPAQDLPALQAWLQAHTLPALRLQVEPAGSEALSPCDSHLGGPPFWPAGEPWPVCGQCDQPLTFIGQVRLDTPGAPQLGEAKLLTFHYCFDCLPSQPEDGSAYRLRLHTNLAQPLQGTPPPRNDEQRPITPCRTPFLPVLSVPHWYDAEPALSTLDLGEDAWESYRTAGNQITQAPNLESRLGGHPDWIQGAAWPICYTCGERMQLIWQLDSEDAAQLMWGDVGRVYLFACPQGCHDQPLALVMQCC